MLLAKLTSRWSHAAGETTPPSGPMLLAGDNASFATLRPSAAELFRFVFSVVPRVCGGLSH